MNQTNKNHPIFPLNLTDEDYFPPEIAGLTKREYFAVKIASSMLASGHYMPTGIGKIAVRIADDLIKELNEINEELESCSGENTTTEESPVPEVSRKKIPKSIWG